MSGGGQYRGSRRYTHTSIRQKSALGVRRSCTLCVSPTSAAASGPPQSAPRVSSSSSSASPCSPKQPLRERAPTVCRPTSLARLHECKPLRGVLLSSAAQQGCGGRTAAALTAEPVRLRKRRSRRMRGLHSMLQHSTTCCNMLQRSATCVRCTSDGPGAAGCAACAVRSTWQGQGAPPLAHRRSVSTVRVAGAGSTAAASDYRSGCRRLGHREGECRVRLASSSRWMSLAHIVDAIAAMPGGSGPGCAASSTRHCATQSQSAGAD